ncbi:MAG: peptide chain release factor N(5)-glutamine methyltransferase [Bacteroidota bacterium]
MTLRELQALFYGQLNPMYEADELPKVWRWWMCERLNCAPLQLSQSMNDGLSVHQIHQLEADLVRFSSGEPLQYILGNTEFFSLKFKCSSSALIPRPETEELVHWILEENNTHDCHFLDIGTGTGCIPLAIKHHRPSWSIAALDCSEEALSLARENASLNSLECQWINYDLLNGNGHFPFNQPFHIVASNPPYIPLRDKAAMSNRVKDFEPNIALFVPDEDPLIFYRTILNFCTQFGAPEVAVYFEIHENFSFEVVELLKSKDFANIEIRKDLQGKERMVRAQRVSLSCES